MNSVLVYKSNVCCGRLSKETGMLLIRQYLNNRLLNCLDAR